MAIPNLKNKRVLITDAGSGIGRAVAIAFAKQGAHIIATDIQPAPLESLQVDVLALGSTCQIHTVDVSNQAAMQELAAQVQR